MNFISSTDHFLTAFPVRHLVIVRIILAGLLFPLGFAPFHLPGLTILSIALFFHALQFSNKKEAFMLGLIFGVGCFGLGISWVIISIHDYGQLNYVLAAFITLLFIFYLALFPAFFALSFTYLYRADNQWLSGLIFASLWPLFEFMRAHFLTGFPWLQLGISQLDTPLKYLAPIIGIYGLSFLCCLAAALLVISFNHRGTTNRLYLILSVLIIISPILLKNKQWVTVSSKPVSVGIIQANLSMRDKWDENLFWQILNHYKTKTESLFGTELIVMPESAIPLPSSYVSDYLSKMNIDAQKAGSAVLLGLLHPTNTEENEYANAVFSLGHAKGNYIKQHLVPFGEYIPKPFKIIIQTLGIPDPGIIAGSTPESLITIGNHPIANLICYEIAYQELLRRQLPLAQWIVSNSDNGWFGHSLASYQQLQMAQMLSLETGRYQVVSNNDGLSSVIDNRGEIVDGLPPFSAGILKSNLYPAEGSTPWVLLGDKPYLLLGLLFIAFCIYTKPRKTLLIKINK